MNPIRVFIVDDSAVVRQILQAALDQDPGIQVQGTAQDPLFAWQRIQGQWPDVLIVDIEMPRMDGISFLRKIMAEHPLPVLICSSLAESGSQVAIDALAAGAVQIITKPQSGVREFLQKDAPAIIQAVKTAARARVRALPQASAAASPAKTAASSGLQLLAQRSTEKVIAIGTSTGGTQALEFVLQRLSATLPGLVIVQHMPEKFTAAFAARLNSISALEVREAQDGDRVLSGRALIAPGGKHMRLARSGAQFIVQVFDGPLVKHHRPSVDVLFRSVAEVAGRNAWGVIMTGMGDDGAQGLVTMHQAGAHTLAQDEESCVVFGMPKEAIRLGGVDEILPLEQIPQRLQQLIGAGHDARS
ncbi:protein-glutamate methylesterase/protein-glutamine glutaminase [Acidithiobacillus sp. AC3]